MSTATGAKTNNLKKVTIFASDGGGIGNVISQMGDPIFKAMGIELNVVPIPLGVPDPTPMVAAGLSEKPEYMDVRNGHVMMAEKVGKEPIFNGYVNIEQSQQQSPAQQQDRVAMENRQREQQQAEAQRTQREPEQRNAAQVLEDNAAWRLSANRTL